MNPIKYAVYQIGNLPVETLKAYIKKKYAVFKLNFFMFPVYVIKDWVFHKV